MNKLYANQAIQYTIWPEFLNYIDCLTASLLLYEKDQKQI